MKHVHFDSLASTNETAKELIRQGERDFCVTANSQTSGKGSRGRSFHSAEGGLYLSVVLPYETGRCNPTVLAAGACSMALTELYGQEINCKWVNDLILNGKKIGGILAESFMGQLILGIGVNVNQQRFPEELSHVSSLGLCSGKTLTIEEVCTAVLTKIQQMYRQEKECFRWYQAHLLTLHHPVRVFSASGERAGYAVDLREDGALLIHFEDSDLVETVQGGTVSIRGNDGYM